MPTTPCDVSLRTLELQTRSAQRAYEAACRELIRRAELRPRQSELSIARAATYCLERKRVLQKFTEELRVARARRRHRWPGS